MDARVYSEEVEPTGLLPPDLGRFNPSNSDINNGNNINISNTQSSLNRLNIRAETGNGLLRYRKIIYAYNIEYTCNCCCQVSSTPRLADLSRLRSSAVHRPHQIQHQLPRARDSMWPRTSPFFSASTVPRVQMSDNIWCQSDLFVANNW